MNSGSRNKEIIVGVIVDCGERRGGKFLRLNILSGGSKVILVDRVFDIDSSFMLCFVVFIIFLNISDGNFERS